MRKIAAILLCCALLSCYSYAHMQSDKDTQFVTVTAYLDCYNRNTGWFMLIDENGESWAFEHTADFRFDMPFIITYSNDFDLVSLQNNGQTVTFEV